MQIVSFSSSSSSSSFARSSGGRCHRAEKGMSRFLHHRRSLPHTKSKKLLHHHPRCQPPLPRANHFAEHYLHHSPPSPHLLLSNHVKGNKLCVKPSKASKKICKLHQKQLLKAFKLTKHRPRHGHHHNHMYCFLPEERFLCTHIGQQLSPGFHHHNPRRHAHPYSPGYHTCSKSDELGGPASPNGMEAPLAEPPSEHGELSPAPAMVLTADEAAMAS